MVQSNSSKFFSILILIGLIVGMFFFEETKINKHKEEIKVLHEKNDSLTKKNDELKIDNAKLDTVLVKIDAKLKQNNKDTDSVITELNEIKKKRNEIPNHVNTLSANATADELTKYLERRTKGKGIKY
jgi:chromosome segregation ATPase